MVYQSERAEIGGACSSIDRSDVDKRDEIAEAGEEGKAG